jgi:hypothetical protein
LGSKSNTNKIKAFNDLLSKVLSVVCIAWVILWVVTGVVWMKQGNFFALCTVFLFGSPALVYLAFRFKKNKDNSLQKVQNL